MLSDYDLRKTSLLRGPIHISLIGEAVTENHLLSSLSSLALSLLSSSVNWAWWLGGFPPHGGQDCVGSGLQSYIQGVYVAGGSLWLASVFREDR